MANTDQGKQASRHEITEWSNMLRLFSSDAWRAMNEFFHDPFAEFGSLDRWFGDFRPSRFRLRIDVVDDGETLRITAELPGMNREDVETTIESGTLILRGEKKQDIRSEENSCYRLERAYGAFVWTIPLPEGADCDKAEAKFYNGVLALRLPKMAAAQSSARQIEIK